MELLKLNNDNYYSNQANQDYVSYSQLKSFAACQGKCIAELNGDYEREDTTPLLVGSYIDSYLDGNTEFGKFKVSHPELFKRDGTLKADFVQADDIIARIESDKVMCSLLKGERQQIMTGMIMGVPVKIKIDSLHPDMIVDGKVMKDCEDIWSDQDGEYVPFWRAYRYDWQAFIYQEIVEQNTGKKLPFVNAVATKQKGIDLRVFRYTEDTIENARQEVCDIITKLYWAKNNIGAPIQPCGHCDYCRTNRKLKKGIYEEI